MKRITKEESKFDLMRLFDRYARDRKFTIHDQHGQKAFLSDLTNDFLTHRDNPILIYGLRTQAMFAHIAAALGHCTVIKMEDAGEVYASDPGMQAPDFRIVTTDNIEFLVEVKNHHPSDPLADFEMTEDYLEGLRRYSSVFQRDLYIAIYWSQWKEWCLINANRLDRTKDHHSISLKDAMMQNEMSILGDMMIGTLPLLELKLYSDTRESRRIQPDGKVECRIGRAEVLVGGQAMVEKKEEEIALFLLIYGNWPMEDSPAEVVDGELISWGVRATPEERANPKERFEIVGHLSMMVSRQYNDITASSGQVDLLTPVQGPDALGVLIPPDLESSRLPLWRFMLRPASPNPTSPA